MNRCVVPYVSRFCSVGYRFFAGLVLVLVGLSAQAGVDQKSVVGVSAQNTVLAGQDFTYFLTYSCPSSLGQDCNGATLTDLLPAEVSYVSHTTTTHVTGVSVTTVGTQTQVEYSLNVPAGDAGQVSIVVRFPLGTTPDGTTATNTATATGLGTPDTSNEVVVTAEAAVAVAIDKTLLTDPAYLDRDVQYRIRLSNTGQLNVSDVTVIDTLPTNASGTLPQFISASPAPDCDPNCASQSTLQWSNLAVNAGQNTDITLTVQYNTPDFTDGDQVTNTATASGVPLGSDPASPVDFGVGEATHTVQTFVPLPGQTFSKGRGGPNPPTISTESNGQEYYYTLNPRNTGNVDLLNMIVVDTLPPDFHLHRVTTGRYINLGNYDDANGIAVLVQYEDAANPGTWVDLGSSTDVNINETLSAPAGINVSRLRWLYGTAQPDMRPVARPRIYGDVLPPAAVGDQVENCATLSSQASAGADPANVTDCSTFNVAGPYIQLDPDKSDASQSGPYFPGDVVRWRVRARLHPYSSTDLPLDRLVLTDYLPQDLIYIGNVSFDAGTAGVPAPTLTQLDNFNNTGRTLLRWTWSAGSGNFPRDSEMFIEFDTVVRQGAFVGALGNAMGMQHNDPTLGERCSSNAETDFLDMDADADVTDQRCTLTGEVTVATSAQLESEKLVKGTCDLVGYENTQTTGGLVSGAAFTYKLSITNTGTVSMENFVLIDILPELNDVDVVNGDPRGSQWTPLLSSPIQPPPGGVVYYSTSSNPCRGEVGGPTTGCDAPNWTVVPPQPISSVRSFKLEFGSLPALPYDSKEFTFGLVAPDGLTPGALAYNSFGWRAYRSDNGLPLGSEPPKVGIDLGSCTTDPVLDMGAELGNFVWIDVNGDGQQNDGPTGLNDIQLRLMGTGVDGVAGTFDDVPLGTTLTANDVNGQAGWYRFPGLTPGDYYICADVPATYAVTSSAQGGDATLDSDFNPVTACTDVISLASSQVLPDIDLGLVPTGTASLGNYVWFDRNADGVQNETPMDGVNGVTVELYIDDGDGVPNVGDFMVAAVATGNDANGFPGYYRFDGLAPGVPYYVEFELPLAATAFTSVDAGGNDDEDSDADPITGRGAIVRLAAGEYDPSHDAGLIMPNDGLILGNQVWFETDNNGLFDPTTETGINGVRLNLYRDLDGNGLPSLGEYAGSTYTFTANGLDGRYLFTGLGMGSYLVTIDLSNFAGGGALEGWRSCSGGSTTPDDDINGDDNGIYLDGALIGSVTVNLSQGGEPITDGDFNADSNLTLDFCFTDDVTAPVQYYDYGDAPDQLAGAVAPDDYQTQVLDLGAAHLLDMVGASGPYLGACVDADNGIQQDDAALSDDLVSGLSQGNCTQADDEDGVTFSATALRPGDTLTVTVSMASASPSSCDLAGWIDWNRNGVFETAEALPFTAGNVSPGGTDGASVTVPATVTPGDLYARFRCVLPGDVPAGGIPPTGMLRSGEVEDYRLSVVGEDWGDLPAGYNLTTAVDGGAVHLVDPANPLLLGSCVDTETDGVESAVADGDDVSISGSVIGNCVDDEDGVSFALGDELFACQVNTIRVTANRAGRLDAWIDFNDDGDFLDANEQVFTDQALNPGVNDLQVTVPCDAVGTRFARFRLSSSGGLTPNGQATDGEVEDYQVIINGFDMGDAPDAYPVTRVSDGALHGVSTSNPLYLGVCVDTETDGQASVASNGDDTASGTGGNCLNGEDDEDGVTFPAVVMACTTVTLNVQASGSGYLDAWMDVDQDNNWTGGSDQILTDVALTPGTNSVPFYVPCTARAGLTQFRFRFSSTQNAVTAPTGAAPDGEVEDYQVNVLGADWGDAPDSYGTTTGSNGAVHGVNAQAPLYLGNCVDTEADGQAGAAAAGDDNGAGLSTFGANCQNDDEDGVVFVNGNELNACQTNVIEVTANANGVLNAWIDLNVDGVFNANERLIQDLALTGGVNANQVSVTIPCNVSIDVDTYARFRFSSQDGIGATGVVSDGEVEDYRVHINGNDFGDAPSGFPVDINGNGALHAVSATNPLYLGACVDTETDGQSSNAADGDDTNGGVGGNCVNNADDEDGVTFPAVVMACTTATLTVQASGASYLDAWMDVDHSGNWVGAGEQIISNAQLTAGSNTISFDVPCVARAGSTSFRFRLSSTQDGVTAPTGAAPDGEVEDYQVNVLGADWGDAPDSYGTTNASGGALHGVDALSQSPLYLGNCVDTEADGQPAAAFGDAADGDDTAQGLSEVGRACNDDDEDGVIFVNSNELFACQSNDITIIASADGILNAWVDFNADGDFDDADEQIVLNGALNAGNNTVTIQVPCDAKANADSYARFRFSSDRDLGSTGLAADGEVEDYLVHINGVDFGDAAASFPVAGNGAARHGVSASYPLYLGNCVDTESDGQPGGGAGNDDGNVGTSEMGTCATAGDDEDGVSFTTSVVACLNSSVAVDVNLPAGAQSAVLDAWFDFNGDGVWDNTNERIFNSQTVSAGTNNLSFNVPCNAVLGNHHVRFRLSEGGVGGPGGSAQYGEVEDYQAYVHLMDLGDLPDSYSTTLANGGPVHLLTASSSLYLGGCVDAEIDGNPGAQDDGDDTLVSPTLTRGTCATAGDDEDGVIFPPVLVLNQCRDVTVVASEAGGYLFAWADFNNDDDFSDTGETLASGMSLNAGPNTLSVCVPATADLGDLHTRFRIVGSDNDPSPYGLAPDGEVEDHLTEVVNEADLSLVKSLVSIDDADGSNTLSPGDRVRFTLAMSNAGPADVFDVDIEDRLPPGFGNITAVSNGGSYDSANHVINWNTLSLARNASLSLTFEATVLPFPGTTEPVGFYTNVAEIMSSDIPDPNSTPGNGVPTEDDQDSVSPIVEPIIDLSLVKSFVLTADNDGSGTETWRDVLTFSVEVTNGGPSTATQVVVVDDLPLGFGNVANISHGGSFDINTYQVIWPNLTLNAGASITLTFEAEITLDADYLNLVQVADALERDLDSTPGNDVPSEDDQSSVEVDVQPVIDLRLEKQVVGGPDFYSGSAVGFEITVFNEAPYDATGVKIIDTLGASTNNHVALISHGGWYVDGQIVWEGLVIPAYGSIKLSYSVLITEQGPYVNSVEVILANEFDLDSVPGNGDGNEDDLSILTINVLPPRPVPTISAWGLWLLSMIMLLIAGYVRHRK